MATNAGNNPNAQKSTVKGVKEFVYDWEGKDRKGKQVRGEMRAAGENIVQTTLRRQGVIPNKIKKARDQIWQINQAKRYCNFHPAICDDDESRRPLVANL